MKSEGEAQEYDHRNQTCTGLSSITQPLFSNWEASDHTCTALSTARAIIAIVCSHEEDLRQKVLFLQGMLTPAAAHMSA